MCMRPIILLYQTTLAAGEILWHRTQTDRKLSAVRFRWIDTTYFHWQMVALPLAWSNIEFDVRLLNVSRLNCDVCPTTLLAAVCYFNTRDLLVPETTDAIIWQNSGHVAVIFPRRASDHSISQKNLVTIATCPALEYHVFWDGCSALAWRGAMQNAKITATGKQSEKQ
jgi:hypothetical protein